MTIPMKKTVKMATGADIGQLVFVTDTQIHPSVKQVERELRDCRRLGAVISDVYKPDEPFVTVRSDGFVSTWKAAYVIHEEPVPYSEGQEASGLKPGDWVKVTRKAADYEGGWGDTWPEEMDRFVGSIGKVDRICDGSGGCFLSGCGQYRYPYFVLEKVTTRPANEEDTGRKCLCWNNEFTIDAIFRTASDGKLWAAVKSDTGSTSIIDLEELQVYLDQSQVQAPEAKKPSWLPEGWRVMGPDEVITSKDKVQGNYHPDLPRSANASNSLDWTGTADSSSVNAQVGKKVSDSQFPKDIWIRKVE